MKSTTDMQTGKSKTKQRQIPFQMPISPIFQWGHIQAWCETIPMKAESTYGDATYTNKKGVQAFLGTINYLSKFSPSIADVCESLRQLTLSKTEWTCIATYQKLFDKGKINNNRRCMCEILWWNATALPGNRCICNQTWSCPITNTKWYKLAQRQSTRQQLTQTHCICKQEPVKCRNKIQQHWKRGTRYTTWAWQVPSLVVCERGKHNNRLQTTSSNLHERCSNANSENTINPPQNTPVQSKNHIQT